MLGLSKNGTKASGQQQTVVEPNGTWSAVVQARVIEHQQAPATSELSVVCLYTSTAAYSTFVSLVDQKAWQNELLVMLSTAVLNSVDPLVLHS